MTIIKCISCKNQDGFILVKFRGGWKAYCESCWKKYDKRKKREKK